MALVVRVQVADDQEGHAGVGRQGFEELGERLQPAGRPADPDDRERQAGPLVFRERRRSQGGGLVGGHGYFRDGPRWSDSRPTDDRA